MLNIYYTIALIVVCIVATIQLRKDIKDIIEQWQ